MTISIFRQAIFTGLTLCLYLLILGGNVSAQNEGVAKLNKRPLLDLSSEFTQALRQKELDLDNLPSFSVTIEGALDANGKLISPVLTRKSGDDNMVKFATRLVAGLNDSELLTYIKNLAEGSEKRKIKFNLSKDEKEMMLQIVSDIGDKDRANKIQHKLNLMFTAFAFLAKAGSDERLILQGIKTEAGEKTEVVIDWKMPNQTFVTLVKKKLGEIENKPIS